MSGRFTVMTDEGDHVIFDVERKRVVSRDLSLIDALHKVGLMNEPYPMPSVTDLPNCPRCTRPQHDGLTCKEQEARLPHVRRSGRAHQGDATDLPESVFDSYCGDVTREERIEFERIT